MNGWNVGFWDVVDRALQGVGRGAAGFMIRKSKTAEEDAAYAIIGGALLCALFGAVVGYAIANLSRHMATSEGVIFGGLLGACSGIFLGSFVDTVDVKINEVLKSFNPK